MAITAKHPHFPVFNDFSQYTEKSHQKNHVTASAECITCDDLCDLVLISKIFSSIHNMVSILPMPMRAWFYQAHAGLSYVSQFWLCMCVDMHLLAYTLCTLVELCSIIPAWSSTRLPWLSLNEHGYWCASPMRTIPFCVCTQVISMDAIKAVLLAENAILI